MRVKSFIEFTTIFKSNANSEVHYRSTADPSVLYKFVSRGRYDRSNDGGYTWVTTSFEIKTNNMGAEFRIIEIHPRNSHILYAYVKPSNEKDKPSFRQGIYFSNDGGHTWSFFTDQVDFFSTSPSDPSVMYGLRRTLTTNQIKKSMDSGQNWLMVRQSEDFNQPWQQGIIPSRIETIYGKRRSDPALLQMDIRFELIPRIYQIAIDPSTANTVYLLTNYGIAKSTDGGDSWRLLSVGLPYAENLNSLGIDPFDPDALYVGTNHDGLWKSNDQGCTWQRLKILERLIH
ncbi:MAG: hypothetical protein HYR55_19085 [Acidobacteria bacterium]|nr:hypothetical protein [Acidobacteriota bacterium]